MYMSVLTRIYHKRYELSTWRKEKKTLVKEPDFPSKLKEIKKKYVHSQEQEQAALFFRRGTLQ